MLSIAIYSENINDTNLLKEMIQDFLIETKIMAKVFYFNEPEAFITVPSSFDIYIIDMEAKEDTIELGKKMMEIDKGSRFIYISNDTSIAYKVAKIKADYFITKPIDKIEFLDILKEIKLKIQSDNIIIPIPGGERRVRANNLNYVNIVKRCLCYHLKDGNMFDGQTLRGSFEKAIAPLHLYNSKAFLFLPPSLLINVGEIKILNSDNIIFENDDVLYFPKKSYETIREAWINYSRIINK